MAFGPLVTAEQLAAHSEWRVFDCRHDLANPDAGALAFAAGHIPGAQFLHLDADLSGTKTGTNGRHPLPDPATLAQRLRTLGVDNDTQIVVHDADVGMFAARAWWLLRWLGHRHVAVLDGGLAAWVAAGHALSCAVIVPTQGSFAQRPSLTTLTDSTRLLAGLGTTMAPLIVDARAPDRFAGQNETLDPVGGHIPGAVNRFFRHNLGADGRFKPADVLRQEFTALLGERAANDTVQQCGSGVTACHNLLAMEIAGLPGATLYPGSWSEWCADPARPVSN